jgi:transposase InsO family protein
LTVFGRQLLVDRIETDGWPIARAAEAAGVSRQTATKWVRRDRELGDEGLEDGSSRPHRSPRSLPAEKVEAILVTRHELGVGPHRLAPVVEVPRSTIGDVLRRHGLSRLADRDRPTGIPIRYVRERPGELLHMDAKKLGRIPDGGGHRFRGRGHGTPRAHAGYDYVHQVVDDMSRVAYATVHADERGTTCAAFLREAAAFFARLGVRIERVMTDNAKNYTRSRAFAGVLDELEARHLTTPPFRPQVTGKSERFNRTMLDEWAYARPYASNEERLAALPGWLDHYNRHRPHTALGGLTPVLNGRVSARELHAAIGSVRDEELALGRERKPRPAVLGGPLILRPPPTRFAPVERHDGVTMFRAEAPAMLEATRDDAWDVVIALEQESGQRLYGYALRLGVDPGRAADLVQEALLSLWRELGRGTLIASGTRGPSGRCHAWPWTSTASIGASPL